MTEILSIADSIVANLLVVIGVLIIVSGAIKTLIEFVRYERRRKAEKHEKGFPFLRTHLSFSIILALPLFIIKLANDAVRAHSSEAYLYIAVLIGLLVIMIISYRKIGTSRKATE